MDTKTQKGAFLQLHSHAVARSSMTTMVSFRFITMITDWGSLLSLTKKEEQIMSYVTHEHC